LRILLLNQCFYPDVVSTAQHLTDLAQGLVDCGHEVTVITSDRGYDDPSRRFPHSEVWKNINIIRIRSLSLGKETKLRRALNFGSFLSVCALRLLTLRGFDVVVALTSPPLISFLAALFVAIKGGRFCFWVMDLNPDEAIAAGWLKDNSLTAQLLKRMLNYSLRRAERTIVLDRFMKDRVLKKGIDEDRISVLAPWSHDDSVNYSAEGRAAFRRTHKLDEKFVVMYSGNHSPCHPLDTLLDAALSLSSKPEYLFCFVGGGSEQTKVKEFAERHRLGNIVCLPYQPLSQLSGSLSAADLHVVVMGNNFAGIVHPCKIYNIMTIGVPTLYIGPPQSHVADLAADMGSNRIFTARHGDHELVVKQITEAAAQQELGRQPANEQVNEQVWPITHDRFSKHALLPQIINLIEFNQTNGAQVTQAVAELR
jgi:glycosyltransferase involved in cell wall biosynthesis